MAERGQPLHPSTGWGVTHLLLRCVRGSDGNPMRDALRAFVADEPNQALTFSVLGGGADLGVMAISPDLDRLDVLVKALTGDQVSVVDSFFSLTEVSEYMSSEDEERARLEAKGADDVEEQLAAWRERIAQYTKAKLHPRLPSKRLLAFYPMSKRRLADDNWYALPFEDRRRLMGGHAVVGRRYAGRILQLITGATGLDDWEWGVTLLSDDATAIKEIVYEMRFDETTTRYGEFGPFWVGMLMDHEAALTRSGLTLRA
ncbi:MAG TPA: chlorite dismutase family protein [Miltoncostaeaceae bacterium]|nr:chlorite dismutase family protein [Miltoncostaeaceae bacterium]